MSLKIKTQTGLNEVADLKIKTADGTLADVETLLIKASDGTLKTIWQRRNPLRMFVETDENSPDYVSLDDVKCEYPEFEQSWYWLEVGNPPTPITAPQGMELLSQKFYDLLQLGEAKDLHSSIGHL